jgi:hypothetical protein
LFRLGQEIQVAVQDGCDSAPLVRIKSVESNQDEAGPGSGNTAPDVVHGPRAACVRAERQGPGQAPRVYTIELEAVDFSGHTKTRTVEVSVPHNRGKQSGCAPATAVAVDDARCVD